MYTLTMNCRTLICVAALAAPSFVFGQAANTAPARSNIKNNVAAATTVVKCKGPDGGPCTGAQVDEIAHGMTTGRRVWKPLAMVKSVSLGGPDGSLKCEQNDGKPCTEEQLKALGELAAKTKCSINYNSSKSNTVAK
jgi:hypothetical protein